MGGGASTEYLMHKSLCKTAIAGAERGRDIEDKIINSFRAWDKDKSGKLSKDELFQICTELNPKVTKSQVDKLVQSIDLDKDGEVSLEEMVCYMFKAPFLEKYFAETSALVEKHVKAAQTLTDKAMATVDVLEMGQARDAQLQNAMHNLAPKVAALKQQQQAESDGKLSPLIKKAFEWHDKDGSGVLERNEGLVFFSNYAGMLPAFHKDILKATVFLATASMENQMAKHMKQFKKVKTATPDQSSTHHDMTTRHETMQAALQAQCTDLDTMLERRKTDYMANAEERHRAAWAVLDVNKDGMLQEAEVLEAMLPGHRKNEEFMRALGLFASTSSVHQGGASGGYFKVEPGFEGVAACSQM